MLKILIFLKRGWVIYSSYKMQMFTTYAGLFVTLVIFYFVSQMVNSSTVLYLGKYGKNYTSFIVVGLIFQWFVSVSLNSFSSSIRSEQTIGTLEFLLISKTNLFVILVYSSLWNFIRILLHSIILLTLASYIFKIEFSFNIVSIFIIILLTVTTLSGIGIMSAGFILAFKQGDPINWFFSAITAILSGVFYPVDALPQYLKNVAKFLPTTYALGALREVLILDASVSSITKSILILLVFAGITVPIGLIIFKWGYNKARIKGNLAEY